MYVMGHEGDTRSLWNPRDADEVAEARRQYTSFKERGFLPFNVNAEGGKGEQMTEFDPEAAKIIFIPPMAGGA